MTSVERPASGGLVATEDCSGAMGLSTRWPVVRATATWASRASRSEWATEASSSRTCAFNRCNSVASRAPDSRAFTSLAPASRDTIPTEPRPLSSADETTTEPGPGALRLSRHQGSEQKGIATYYDANGSGNCGFDPGADLMVAAMNREQYDNSAVCGECVDIVGPKGSVRVRIVDQCPDCDWGHLDLSRWSGSARATGRR